MNAAASDRELVNHARLIAFEEALSKAVEMADPEHIWAIGLDVGELVDAAFERRDKGIRASDCDRAAMALANIAIFVSNGLDSGGPMKGVALAAALRDLDEYEERMSACETKLGLRPSQRTLISDQIAKL